MGRIQMSPRRQGRERVLQFSVLQRRANQRHDRDTVLSTRPVPQESSPEREPLLPRIPGCSTGHRVPEVRFDNQSIPETPPLPPVLRILPFRGLPPVSTICVPVRRTPHLARDCLGCKLVSGLRLARRGPAVADLRAATPGGRRWADLMRRSYGLDVLACPRCGGRLRLVALIEERSVIERILKHLGLPAEVPATRPGRAPPCLDESASA
jgi:hypothetical protein